MPQIQVLPYVPSFIEGISPALQQAAGTIGGALAQRRDNISDQKILEQLGKNPELKGLDLIANIGKLSSKTQKSLSPLFEKHLSGQQTNATEQHRLEQKQIHGDVLNRIEKLIKYSGSTSIPFTSSWFGESLNRRAVEKREELDDLAITLEGVLRDMSTKGSLPQQTFETLLKKLPSSKKSERQNKGSVKAFRRILGLQTPEIQEAVNKALESSGENSGGNNARINVYDSTGKVVGTVNKNEANNLPQGYTAK